MPSSDDSADLSTSTDPHDPNSNPDRDHDHDDHDDDDYTQAVRSRAETGGRGAAGIVGQVQEVQEAATPDSGSADISYVLNSWKSGSYVEVVPVRAEGALTWQRGGGRRGKVKGFSAESQQRLLQHLFKLPDDALESAVFVTLTLLDPQVTTATMRIYWARYRKRLLYRYPDSAGYWRLEFQDRGVPHLHVLICGLGITDQNIGDIQTWLRAQWIQCLGYSDSPRFDHLVAADRVRDKARIRWYLAKIAQSQPGDHTENTGRVWGKFGHITAYEGATSSIPLTSRQAAQLRRLFDGIKLSQARRHPNPKRRALKVCRARRRRWDPNAFRFYGRVDVQRFLAEID